MFVRLNNTLYINPDFVSSIEEQYPELEDGTISKILQVKIIVGEHSFWVEASILEVLRKLNNKKEDCRQYTGPL